MATPVEFRHFRAVLVEYVPRTFFRRFIGPSEMRWLVEHRDADGGWRTMADTDDSGARFTADSATSYARGLEAGRIVMLLEDEREEQGISDEDYSAALDTLLQ